MRTVALVFCLSLLLSGTSFGHAVDFRISATDAHVVEVFQPGGRRCSNQDFELRGPGDMTPFQTGRTDRLGRVVFVPDRSGTWSLRVWAEDGHGITTNFEIEVGIAPEGTEVAGEGVSASARNPRLRRIGIGVLVVLAIGTVLFLQARRKNSAR